MTYIKISLFIPMVMMRFAYLLTFTVLGPYVAIIVDESKFGTAYEQMMIVQNIGLACFNLPIGCANYFSSGYTIGMRILSTLGVAFVLSKSKEKPGRTWFRKGFK